MILVGVSGLTGMIGRNFIDWYMDNPAARARWSLVAFTRRDRCPEFLVRAGIPCRRVDFRAAGSFAGKVEDLDVFLHLAGQVRAVRPREFYEVNRDGTAVLLEALSRYGGKLGHFLLASSQAATGPSAGDGEARDEAAPPRPVSHYGRSKLAAEEVVRASGLSWTILRLSSVWGPYDRDGLNILKTARRGLLPLLGGDRLAVSYIFAQDLAPLLPRMFLNERLFGGTFNVCYDEPIRLVDYCRAVRRELGLPPGLLQVPLPRWTALPAMGALAVLRRVAGGDSIATADKLREISAGCWVLDNGRLRQALGLASLRENGALAGTVRWFRERELL